MAIVIEVGCENHRWKWQGHAIDLAVTGREACSCQGQDPDGPMRMGGRAGRGRPCRRKTPRVVKRGPQWSYVGDGRCLRGRSAIHGSMEHGGSSVGARDGSECGWKAGKEARREVKVTKRKKRGDTDIPAEIDDGGGSLCAIFSVSRLTRAAV
jgi:hypothetical protein